MANRAGVAGVSSFTAGDKDAWVKDKQGLKLSHHRRAWEGSKPWQALCVWGAGSTVHKILKG